MPDVARRRLRVGVLTANDEKRCERVSFTHGDGYDAIPKRNSVFGC